MKFRTIISTLTLLLMALDMSASLATAADGTNPENHNWPQLRGPASNGISQEKGWTSTWPAEGPPVLWKRDLGSGFSSPSIAGNRLFIEGTIGLQNRLWCLDATTGEMIWTYDYSLPGAAGKKGKYPFAGPTSTPTVDGDFLYVASRGGQVFCFEAATGKLIWSVVHSISTDVYGLASSPLIVNEKLIVVAGGKSNLMIALDKKSGKKLWSSGDDRAAYATPVLFQYKGQPALAVSGRSLIVGVLADDGKVLFTYPWPEHRNTSDVVISGDKLLAICSSTVHGPNPRLSTLFRISDPPGGLEEICKFTPLRQLGTPVLFNKYIFGLNGNWGRLPKYKNNFALHCMDFETGKERWSKGAISGALTIADDKLLILTVEGILIVAEANPDKYVELGRVKVVDGWCYAPPVLSNGKIYCRNSGDDLSQGTMGLSPEDMKGGWLVCLDVSAKAKAGVEPKIYPRPKPPTSEAKTELTSVENKASTTTASEQLINSAVAQEFNAANSWQRFHGLNGMGYLAAAKPPETWNVADGTNIVWKCKLPLSGASSPIICQQRIIVSGASAAEQRLICVSRDKGSILWDKAIAGARDFTIDDLNIDRNTTAAAPTPITDGTLVFVLFGTGDIAALKVDDGTEVWSRNLGKPKSTYGVASSPIVCGETLIVQYPGAETVDILGLNRTTGKTVWSIARTDIEESWATPVLINSPKRQELVFVAAPKVFALDPHTGKELWMATGIGGEIGPSPMVVGDTLFAAQANSCLLAIRTGGSGDITKTGVLWKVSEGLPDVASPASDGKRLFLAAAEEIHCYQVETGKVLWKQEIPGDFYASPVIAGDRVYAITKDGKVHVFQSADKYEKISEVDMQQSIYATPALADDRIYIRGESNLYCVGKN